MSPEEVAALFEAVPDASGLGDGGEGAALSYHELAATKRQLGGVLDTCSRLWEAKNPVLDAVAEKIGDGVRNGPWRVPLGESGILSFFVNLLREPVLRPSLKKQVWRIIANACAYCDENRSRVLADGGLDLIVGEVTRETSLDGMASMILMVLLNICIDNEPCQRAVLDLGLVEKLVGLASSEESLSEDDRYIPAFRLIEMVAPHDAEGQRLGPELPRALLSKYSTISPDELTPAYTAAVLSLLSREVMQRAFVAAGHLPHLLAMFDALSTLSPECMDDEPVRADFIKQRRAAVSLLVDITALDEFRTLYSHEGGPIDTLKCWLASPDHSEETLQAACLCLGNVARNDAAAAALAQSTIPADAVKLLRSPDAAKSPQLIHAVLSLLRNLAVRKENRPILGHAGVLEVDCLPVFWAQTASPQVQFVAVSLSRLLVTGCVENVRSVITLLPPDRRRTRLDSLMDIFKTSDSEPTKTEAARTALAICRSIHSAEADGPLIETFYEHHQEIHMPLGFLVSQHKWPALRSESHFVFALMCRTLSGADAVLRVYLNAQAVGALVRAATGEDADAETIASLLGRNALETAAATSGASQVTTAIADEQGGDLASTQDLQSSVPSAAVDPAATSEADRQNSLFMISGLLNNASSSLEEPRRAAFRRLLDQGIRRAS